MVEGGRVNRWVMEEIQGSRNALYDTVIVATFHHIHKSVDL